MGMLLIFIPLSHSPTTFRGGLKYPAPHSCQNGRGFHTREKNKFEHYTPIRQSPHLPNFPPVSFSRGCQRTCIQPSPPQAHTIRIEQKYRRNSCRTHSKQSQRKPKVDHTNISTVLVIDWQEIPGKTNPSAFQAEGSYMGVPYKGG